MYMYVYILYVTPQNDFAVDSLIPKFLHAITTLSSIIYICIATLNLMNLYFLGYYNILPQSPSPFDNKGYHNTLLFSPNTFLFFGDK